MGAGDGMFPALYLGGATNVIEILKNRQAICSLEELVASYPASEFDSPCRSTVPLLDYWRSPKCAVQRFEKLVSVKFADQIQLLFEYRVPVQAGRGKASFTDLMIVDSSIAVGIEAKYMESRYQIVSQWIKKGSDEQNRKKVLGGWLSLIQSVTNVSLTFDDICSLPYQLIHRIASVCHVSATSRYVVYQLFDPAKQDYYSEYLHTMAGFFRESSTLSLLLMLCPLEPLEDYQVLLRRWHHAKTPKPKLSSQVKPKLLSRRLACFHEPQLVRFA